jgi:putative hydrolase of the HAD superfamily
MSALRVVLCDLDDTLFDHYRATEIALERLRDVEPDLAGEPFDVQVARHRHLLDTYHRELLAGRMTLDQVRIARFQGLVGNGCDADRALQMARRYRQLYEQCWYTVPGAVDLASAIKQSGVAFVVVTNNLIEEQRLKLEHCGLTAFVDHLVTSEETGVAKPQRGIFDAALDRSGASADEAVMLGDSWEVDVLGAQAAGIRAVWFNRFGRPRPDETVAQLQAFEPVADAMRVLRAGGRV